ncbi:hypothetical protein DH09_02345 [Bacillaceae bacterium JMAK1]|nr:hypothetical protein DH09_02345 [Bacillaceae bacterium JMAK1]
MFYHIYGPLDSHEKINRTLRDGLNPLNISDWSGMGSGFMYNDLMNAIKEGDTDQWMEFSESIRLFNSNLGAPDYIKISLPKEKVYVFNLEIASDIFAYIEEEGLGEKGVFTSELPNLDVLIRDYWNSKIRLDLYELQKPYPNPEFVSFQNITRNDIEVYINFKKLKS